MWIVPIGLTASLGQWCTTRAYSLLLFGDDIVLIGWLGMGLIVAATVASFLVNESWRRLPTMTAM